MAELNKENKLGFASFKDFLDNKTEDSLKKRYLYKLFANFVGFLVNIGVALIVPRSLKAKAYGDFSFLTNFFTRLVGFLDMGTATCFYTKLSKRQSETGLVTFYFYFTVIISLLIAGFTLIAHLTLSYEHIWPGQAVFYIYLAAGWAILSWIIQVLHSIADAYGVTVLAEFARLSQKLVFLVMIIFLFVVKRLNLSNFFFCHFLAFFFLAIALVWILIKKKCLSNFSWLLSLKKIWNYIQEFYQYCYPLFIFLIVGMITGIFDRWLLQYYRGSVEQGFYSLSYQIGVICFLFTGAMTPLLMREFSIASHNKDNARMTYLFRRYIPLLYSIAAYFSCFVAINANKIVHIIGGNFDGAIKAVTVMAFYPIHQTYGQLSSSIFYATGRTKLYSNISIISLLAGLPVTYFLIAPNNKMGLNAGATGLAIKMVLLNFIGVNIQVFLGMRFLHLSFWYNLIHQFLSVGSLITLALCSSIVIKHAPYIGSITILNFLLAGIFYTVMVMTVAYLFPFLFGMRRKDINSIISIVSHKFTAEK
jgi:O-antigen/teichoic acid export membrane protein